MKTINESSTSITIEMTDTERWIIRQTFGTYVSGLGAHKLTRHIEYSFLADLDLKLLSKKIRDQFPADEIILNNNLENIAENNVSMTLNNNEWAICLFFLIDSSYGCIISTNDLYCLTSYRRHEIIAVMVKLHEQLENTVSRLMDREKCKMKKENRWN